jgi:hypothetical protein
MNTVQHHACQVCGHVASASRSPTFDFPAAMKLGSGPGWYWRLDDYEIEVCNMGVFHTFAVTPQRPCVGKGSASGGITDKKVRNMLAAYNGEPPSAELTNELNALIAQHWIGGAA